MAARRSPLRRGARRADETRLVNIVNPAMPRDAPRVKPRARACRPDAAGRDSLENRRTCESADAPAALTGRAWLYYGSTMRRRRAGGGLAAIRYSLAKAREAGGVRVLVRGLSAHNACKTCALGMSGMRNERGSFPEVCKKGVQAQAADMQPPIGDGFFPP